MGKTSVSPATLSSIRVAAVIQIPLQLRNQNFNSKSENRVGYFKVEIQEALSPFFFDNQQKLSCISSAMHLIKILGSALKAYLNKGVEPEIHIQCLYSFSDIYQKFMELQANRPWDP